MACVFVLPRALLQYKFAHELGKETDAIRSLSFKLFRFGLLMCFLALFFGTYLWLQFDFSGTWLTLKLVLVGLLFIYYIVSGWLLYRAIKFGYFLSGMALRVFNESSLLFAIPIIYLVVSKNA
jgi:putative membrane protein